MAANPDHIDLEGIRELLERLEGRNLTALEGLRNDTAELRRVLDRDRDAWRQRCDRVEAQVDRYGRRLGEVIEEVEDVGERCRALIVEEVVADGDTVIRPARASLDTKTAIGLIVTLITAAVVPIIVAVIANGGAP